jgi:hypothetical protein
MWPGMQTMRLTVGSECAGPGWFGIAATISPAALKSDAFPVLGLPYSLRDGNRPPAA